MHKYGINFVSTKVGNNDHGNCCGENWKIIYKANEEWNHRRVINKWYICNGCEIAKYCSRKCQKIVWKNGHRMYCTDITNYL